MFRRLLFVALCASLLPSNTYAQETAAQRDGSLLHQPASCSPGVTFSPENLRFIDGLIDGQDVFDVNDLASQVDHLDYVAYVMQGESPGNGNGASAKDPHDHPNGGGTGLHAFAASRPHLSPVHKTNKTQHPSSGGTDPTDPSAILTQIQLQNTFTFETYNASGYANTAVVQPVLPFPVAMPGLKEFAPFHIIRPTLPFPAPTADPDGPLGVQGGMGDFTLLDVAVHPMSWGNIVFGYSLIAPTSTDPQLGLQEWQLGPSLGFVYKKVPKTVLGLVTQVPFSLESDAQEVDVQLVAVRHLPNEWYLRWGDTFSIFNTDTGAYNIPIQPAIGKVFKKGLFGVPTNVFLAAE